MGFFFDFCEACRFDLDLGLSVLPWDIATSTAVYAAATVVTVLDTAWMACNTDMAKVPHSKKAKGGFLLGYRSEKAEGAEVIT